jgi:hypothetical protein
MLQPWFNLATKSQAEGDPVSTALLIGPLMGGAYDNSGKSHSSQTRFGEKTPGDLRKAAETLIELAGQFTALADAMDDRKIKRVRMDGAMKLPKGISLIRTFAVNVQKGLLDLSRG